MNQRRVSGPFWVRVAVITPVALPLGLFFAAFFVGLGSSNPTQVRVRGLARLAGLSGEQAWWLLLTLGICMAALFLWACVCALWGEAQDQQLADADPSRWQSFLPGETVRWTGRPGWRSFDRSRQICAVAALPPLIAYGAWLWRIWGNPGPLENKLFWSFAATTVVGSIAFAVVAAIGSAAREWLLDMFGSIVVTDRRIAWLSPTGGQIYRQVERDRLVDVALVEGGGSRAWIALSIRGENFEVSEVDLLGMPDHASALVEMRKLIGSAVESARLHVA